MGNCKSDIYHYPLYLLCERKEHFFCLSLWVKNSTPNAIFELKACDWEVWLGIGIGIGIGSQHCTLWKRNGDK